MVKYLVLIFFFPASVIAQADTVQKIVAGRSNSKTQQQKPYVILISADGFRHDFAERYNAKSLLSLSEKGVRAESMIPPFPSLTYPSHYALITGLHPAHNGIVNNDFYDPQRKDTYGLSNRKKVEDGSWYGGIPLWVLAEQQQMLSASFYYVASEANIMATFPTYWYRYNEKIPIDKRIQIVVNWLNLPEEKRPHFISFYFPEVDHDAHVYGPDSPEAAASVRTLDSSIHKLNEAVKATGLPVNFIFVSDHGMTKVNANNTLSLPPELDTSRFIIPSEGILVSLHAKNKADILPAYTLLKKRKKDYTVYLKEDLPSRYFMSANHDKFNRVGDIILVPTWPNVFNIKKRKVNPGWHGYDPELIKDMHATFFAWGPAFKQNITIPSFKNIHVYPLIAQMLGLTYQHKIDGEKKVLSGILR